MVKALGSMYCKLFPLLQDWPVISGRTLKLFLAALAFTPHGSPPRVVPVQGTPPARLVQVVPCSWPVMVMALPVAALTPVLVSHPPIKPFTKPFRPSRVGRL